jgi:hypothetical protein
MAEMVHRVGSFDLLKGKIVGVQVSTIQADALNTFFKGIVGEIRTYKTTEEWEEETGLSRSEQETARKHLKRFMEVDLRGIPATLYYRLNKQEIYSALGVQFAETLQTSLPEPSILVSDIPANINSNTETTTENTTARPQKSKFSDPTWDILHGKMPTEEGLEMARRIEGYTDIANRLSSGLRRGEFPQSIEAQKVYRWIAEREANGESLDDFISWAMDGKRAEFSFVYHKDTSLIKRDWPQATFAKSGGMNPQGLEIKL